MRLDTHARTREAHVTVLDPRAIDGDTIEARLDLGFGTSLIRRIRLKGFYAAELEGQTPDAARAAQQRLQTALYVGELSIQERGSREDRYGRLVAILFRDGVALNPFEVLGPFQIEEAVHARDVKFAAANRTRTKRQAPKCQFCQDTGFNGSSGQQVQLCHHCQAGKRGVL